MNTPSNKVKAQFFAMYWEQEVLKYEDSEGDPFWDKQIYPVDGHNIACNGLQLHLRSVDQLTVEEYITVAKLAYGNWDETINTIGIVPNADKIHHDILSVGIDRFIDHPADSRIYKDCHIQIDRVDLDINKYSFRNDGKEVKDEIIDSSCQWAVLDYLRSIGILLPFTYLSEDNKPITLSPSDLIGFGWVKMEK